VGARDDLFGGSRPALWACGTCVAGSTPARRLDAFDRPRWRSSWAGGETFSYDPTTFRLTSVSGSSGTRSYGHDARGNVTSRPGFTHTFDATNRLTQSQAPGSNPERYHYDGHGRRTATFRANGAVAVDYYTRDGVLRGRADTALPGTIVYIHLGDQLVAQDAWQWRSPFGRTYFHTDHLGTPLARSDFTGTVFERTRRQSFGQPLVGPLKDGPGYTGHMEDPGTGLVYMQQRYYDPTIARFLSVDPVGPLADPTNHFGRYHYALNNPYRYTDPDGRLPILIPAAILAWRAYSAYDTATTIASSVVTLADANASGMEKAIAGAEIAGSLVGGKYGREGARAAASMAENAGDAARASDGGLIGMDDAVSRATDHVNGRGVMETTGSGNNYQFRNAEVNEDGDVVTKIGRFDVNPADGHVQKEGSHLNLETQVNGKTTENSHIPIDPSTVRRGDHPRQ
jgi:RHS repeat-associated protein